MRNRFQICSPICIVMCIILIVSCRPTVPSSYIQPNEMENILYDYHISQAMGFRNLSSDQSSTYKRNLYYHAVLRKYGVTEAEFDSSLIYYYSHVDKLRDIYKKVSERMEKNAMNLGTSVGEIAKYSQLNADGDTANIWSDSQTAVLIPAPPYNRMDFVINTDSTFKRGDSFLFNFMTNFVYQTGTKDAVICIAIHYDNDSISTHYNHISVSGISQLRIPENRKNNIKEIRGFIYLSGGNDQTTTQKLMFIDRIQMIRFHHAIEEKDSIRMSSKDSVVTNNQEPLHMKRTLQDTVINPKSSHTNASTPRVPAIRHSNNATKNQTNSRK